MKNHKFWAFATVFLHDYGILHWLQTQIEKEIIVC